MLRLAIIIGLCLGAIPPVQSADRDAILTVFQSHCVKCHGQEGKVKGKVNLLELGGHGELAQKPELLSELIEVIEFEEMPPEDEDQLDPGQRAKLLADLKALRVQSATAGLAYEPTPIRRMNRFQYNNAVIDLFGLKCIVFTLPERMMREHNGYFKPETGKMAAVVTVGSRPLGKSQMIEQRLAGVAAFPQDLRAEHGYDNQADHLSLSPLLMESFLKLGRSITESPDFEPRNVGIWNSFFLAPPENIDPVAEARRRLSDFLTRAFRRPAEAAELDRYSEFVASQIKAGAGFTEAMRSAAAATISSPKFLYLYDRSSGTGGEAPGRIDSFELASRLSFFLWGSLPDQALLDLAAAGKLVDPDVLETQVTRMLKDRKLKRFCDSFPSQWLQLERIISSVPNRKQFPGFYFLKYRDSMHMMLEPLLVFETVLLENQPITQLIDSDFTYRSKLLEEAYGDLATGGDAGAKGGGGSVERLRFERVPVNDRRNGGVITNAAVMTMTSGPERTQPITRGAWIAGVIFNDPPDPPPADVPPLGEKPTVGEENLTLRERLSAHRQRSDCRGCHEQIDPLGFALENYGPIGTWRERYANGRKIDMSGTLMRQHPFNSVTEFKDAILSERDRFTRGLAGHLLAFALARELGSADQIALDQIASETAADGYKIHTLIRALILSTPFQTKTNPGAEP
ncbi:MAG: DUF1592 domain-containing protein [Verrucomicrobiales bacterium]